ncbi:hypothetical protein EJV46_17830 [Roseococcus sp. SYP-B2431]|uniref:hypothetical protein n=1 Tax=Roseococcus sp. SYP-B2431 TaxID=2496640 RepID=UPI001039AD7F|nr:hypothetical protein [Roseococcus sp. SYP-B2431]TCH97171.1 hypothetical protein EJV46_17830 [Roseococcus sp. SYP-B2431]
MRRATVGLAFALLAASAAAQDRIGVRTGDHPGFGRIVFDWTAAPRYRMEQEGDRVLLRFPDNDAIDLTGARRLPRNLLAVNRTAGAIELTLRPGARIRHFRNGPKVAFDIMDPSGDVAARPPAAATAPRRGGAQAEARPAREAAPAPASGREDTARGPLAGAPPSPPPIPLPPSTRLAFGPAPMPEAPPNPASPPVGAAPAPAVETPRNLAATAAPPREAARATPGAVGPRSLLDVAPTASAPPPLSVLPPLAGLAGPQPIRARLVEEAGQGAALRLPAGAGVAAAALRRGEQALVLLETERPIEFGALLRAPAFAGIQAQRLAGATLISWTLAPDRQLVLRQEGPDWFVVPVPREQPTIAAPLRAEIDGGQAVLHTERPSRVVTVNDPLTGLPLLIGTVSAAAPRQMATRNLAEFDLLETFLGVAVLARADRVALRAGSGRFLLSIEGGAVAVANGTLEGGLAETGMTRSFDIPSQPVPALQERLRSQQASVGAAAPLLRAEPRIAAAQTLLALGLPQEAQAMLRLAVQESPSAARDGRQLFLSGMAALLSGRSAEARGLDAELPASDEIILWRALRVAIQGEAGAAAPGLAATVPLLLSYPEGLRRRLLPIAAEALAEGGQPAASRRLLEAAGEDPPLLLAQGLLEEAQGNTDAALGAYEAAAASRDRLMRARAVRRGIELRLATGRLDAAGAARQLELTLFAWRGDAQEISTRERLAALRRQAGDPRAALALLRETEALFPDRAPALRDLTQQAFLQALETEPPLGAVGLYDAHPELLPSGEAGEATLALLADRLTALDLPDRAAGLLRRAMERLPAGEGRAALGARLAAQRLGERDAAGALEALAISSAPRLAPELIERRSLLAAQAEARRGHRELAAEALKALGPAGDEALSDILAEARDFAGAAAALSRHLAGLAPAGPASLPEPLQRLALRNAVFLAMAGDEPGLAAHRARYAARMARPELAAAFEVLTADPVRGLADLPRLARELNLFRRLPQSLEPLRTALRTTG